jgi:hypothetical protein
LSDDSSDIDTASEPDYNDGISEPPSASDSEEAAIKSQPSKRGHKSKQKVTSKRVRATVKCRPASRTRPTTKCGNTAKHNAGAFNDDVDNTDNAVEVEAHTRGIKLNLSFPPLSNIQDIFKDMASRTLYQLADGSQQDLRTALSKFRGRKLCIGTVCSGTESPILAITQILNYVNHNDLNEIKIEIEMSHEFSVEIVPEKQAYIQVNFAPKILFRDVTEFSRLTENNGYA